MEPKDLARRGAERSASRARLYEIALPETTGCFAKDLRAQYLTLGGKKLPAGRAAVPEVGQGRYYGKRAVGAESIANVLQTR